MSDYLLSLVPFLAINVLLATSLNLLVGYSGLMSVSQGASMGVGAYGAAVLATREHLAIALCILLAAILAGVVGLVFMALVAQLATDDFILASFAFQMCVIAVFQPHLYSRTRVLARAFGVALAAADVVAVGHNNRGYRRVRFVFDCSSGTPLIVYRQDLTYLGWPLGKKLHDQLLAQNAK